MSPTFDALLGSAIRARLVLLVNHVLSRESAAVERLRGHAGVQVHIELTDQPPFLPPWPPMTLAVTPAGLFELQEGTVEVATTLTVRVAMPDPARALAIVAGDARPEVHLEGDAALAADMNWLVENLRWDIEADIAEIVGPAAAHFLASAGRGLVAALRRFAPVPAAPSR